MDDLPTKQEVAIGQCILLEAHSQYNPKFSTLTRRLLLKNCLGGLLVRLIQVLDTTQDTCSTSEGFPFDIFKRLAIIK